MDDDDDDDDVSLFPLPLLLPSPPPEAAAAFLPLDPFPLPFPFPFAPPMVPIQLYRSDVFRIARACFLFLGGAAREKICGVSGSRSPLHILVKKLKSDRQKKPGELF